MVSSVSGADGVAIQAQTVSQPPAAPPPATSSRVGAEDTVTISPAGQQAAAHAAADTDRDGDSH